MPVYLVAHAQVKVDDDVRVHVPELAHGELLQGSASATIDDTFAVLKHDTFTILRQAITRYHAAHTR